MPTLPWHEFNRRLARNIRERREALGLSPAEVGRKARMTAAYIQRIEKGRHRLTLEGLAKLSAALHIEPGELVRVEANELGPKEDS